MRMARTLGVGLAAAVLIALTGPPVAALDIDSTNFGKSDNAIPPPVGVIGDSAGLVGLNDIDTLTYRIKDSTDVDGAVLFLPNNDEGKIAGLTIIDPALDEPAIAAAMKNLAPIKPDNDEGDISPDVMGLVLAPPEVGADPDNSATSVGSTDILHESNLIGGSNIGDLGSDGYDDYVDKPTDADISGVNGHIIGDSTASRDSPGSSGGGGGLGTETSG